MTNEPVTASGYNFCRVRQTLRVTPAIGIRVDGSRLDDPRIADGEDGVRISSVGGQKT
jgi:hypothetical protein